MEKQGYVSIWLGSCKSISKLERYVEAKYTRDGDSVDSAFEKGFEIGYFDEDFREINFLDTPSNSIGEILEGHSYYKSITRNIVELIGDKLDKEYNAVVLLYNFEYKGSKKEVKSTYGTFRYITSVEYDRKEY